MHQMMEKQDIMQEQLDDVKDELVIINSRLDSTNARIDGVEIKAELRHCDLMDALNEKVELLKDTTINHEHRIVRVEHKLELAV